MRNKWRHEIIIYWGADDQAYVAEVPELPGCAADGATYRETLANAEVIIREWIETAKKLRRPVPEPKGRLMFAWTANPLSPKNAVDAVARRPKP